jgi:hypothetical protein
MFRLRPIGLAGLKGANRKYGNPLRAEAYKAIKEFALIFDNKSII